MNTQALLDQHPSVQALTIGNNKVNPTKAAMHQRTINARPFTTASAVLAAHKGSRKDAKGAHVEVVRHEANIRAAAVAAAAAAAANKSGTGGGFKVTATTKLAEKRGLPAKPAAPAGSDSKLPPVNRPPSRSSSSAAKPGKKTAGDRDEVASLVSSAPSSFEPTSSRAASYSDYSCSCCHPRKAPSSVVTYSTGVADSKRSTAPSAFSSTSVPLSAYENMTSISERIAKQKAAAGGSGGAGRAKPSSRSGAASSLTGSMTSTKLRALESELAAEREHRRHTEEELAEIKARQDVLLSRLSDKERDEVRRLAAQVREESSRVSDKR